MCRHKQEKNQIEKRTGKFVKGLILGLTLFNSFFNDIGTKNWSALMKSADDTIQRHCHYRRGSGYHTEEKLDDLNDRIQIKSRSLIVFEIELNTFMNGIK